MPSPCSLEGTRGPARGEQRLDRGEELGSRRFPKILGRTFMGAPSFPDRTPIQARRRLNGTRRQEAVTSQNKPLRYDRCRSLIRGPHAVCDLLPLHTVAAAPAVRR
jgi:hypothetical protein